MNAKGLLFIMSVAIASVEVARAGDLAEVELNVVANLGAESCHFDSGTELNYRIPDTISTKVISSATGWGTQIKIGKTFSFKCDAGKRAKMTVVPKSEICMTSKGAYSCGGVNKTIGMLPSLEQGDVRADLVADKITQLDVKLDEKGIGSYLVKYVHFSKLLDSNIPPAPGELYAEIGMTVWNY